MTRTVLILGATGQIARHVIDVSGKDRDLRMTLFARHPKKLGKDRPPTARVIQGDVLDARQLRDAITGQDMVYANLTGDDLDVQAESVVAAMKSAGVERLIFVLSLGIYDEVPGKFGAWNRRMIGEDLKPFRRAGDTIEASGLDYTLIRPAWLTDADEVDYELTGRHEPFRGTEVSRRSVADLIARIIASPTLHSRENVGVNKPNTDGDKPAFM